MNGQLALFESRKCSSLILHEVSWYPRMISFCTMGTEERDAGRRERCLGT